MGILLTSSVWVFLVVHNQEDTFSVVESDSISEPVKVYRDSRGTPTIIGSNIKDVLYAQGYEFARDRLWQLEFYRSVMTGELSRIFGESQLNADRALRKLGIYRAALAMESKLDAQHFELVQSYVNGINDYIDSHKFHLPLEFQLLGVKPKKWSVAVSLGIQGVMAFDLAYGGLVDELLRLDLVKTVGGEKSLEILPITYQPAADYIRNLTKESVAGLGTAQSGLLMETLGKLSTKALGIGSNNWVISGNLTQSGAPILANDMHLGLSVPGIWNQVHLIATDGSLHVQGFSLPGIPLVVAGHNEHVAWGYTNTGLDAIDLYYLTHNETHYLVNGTEWLPFTIYEEEIPVSGGDPVAFSYKVSKFGVLDTIGEQEYAIRWTLTEGFERDQIFRAIMGLNTAKNASDIHEALRYFGVPGQNVVFAIVDGDIGYQFAGIIPIRKSGYGLIPQNGSDGSADWLGIVPYEDQLFVLNPSKGYFATANEEIDDRHLFYIADGYAVGYRGKRINQILANQTNFDLPFGKFTEQDVMRMQGDTYSLAFEDLLLPVLSNLKSYDFSSFSENDLITNALTLFDDWDRQMITSSIEATIFVVYRINLIHWTFVDELGSNLAQRINYGAHVSVAQFLKSPSNVTWFDDVNTTETETHIDIAAKAFANTVSYLKEKLGDDMTTWKWGRVHQATFSHVMGSVFPFLNVGPLPSNGTAFTVNAGGGQGSDITNLKLSQSHGPSERFVIRVDGVWDNIYGLTPPGNSGNLFSKHYGNAFEDWLNIRYVKWEFNQEDAEQLRLTATYHKEV